jgi:copper chaperone CopZ
MNQTFTYLVPDISSGHCRAAITVEVGAIAGVASVAVDLEREAGRGDRRGPRDSCRGRWRSWGSSAALHLVSSTLVLFGAYDQTDPPGFLVSVPEIAWEASLGI